MAISDTIGGTGGGVILPEIVAVIKSSDELVPVVSAKVKMATGLGIISKVEGNGERLLAGFGIAGNLRRGLVAIEATQIKDANGRSLQDISTRVFHMNEETVQLTAKLPSTSDNPSGNPDVPGIPRNLFLFGGSATGIRKNGNNWQFALSWDAPESAGKSPITSYILFTYDENLNYLTQQNVGLRYYFVVDVPILPNPATNPNRFYSVAAVNSYGTGGQSDKCAAVFQPGEPIHIPSAPQNLTIPQAWGSTTFNLSWQRPADDGFRIDRYIITRTMLGVPVASNPVQQPGPTKTFETTGTAFTDNVADAGDYTYTVKAQNPTGTSPASNSVTMRSNGATPWVAKDITVRVQKNYLPVRNAKVFLVGKYWDHRPCKTHEDCGVFNEGCFDGICQSNIGPSNRFGYTDAEGNITFNNVPWDEWQIVIDSVKGEYVDPRKFYVNYPGATYGVQITLP